MNAQEAPQQVPKPFVFCSSAGEELCRCILKEHLPYEPHDVQIEGICKVLDHIDLFAILAMGTGKMGFRSMYMLVVLAIQKDPSLCLLLRNRNWRDIIPLIVFVVFSFADAHCWSPDCSCRGFWEHGRHCMAVRGR